MGEWKDKGIILRAGHFRENDMWLKMLMRDRGIMTVFAFGGACSRRRFCGCLDILNTLECRVHSNRTGQYMNLEEASLVSSPGALRSKWRNMGFAANCLKFTECLGIGPDASRECFAIVENMRKTFEKDVPQLGQYFFRLRMAAALGYAPDFLNCGHCGAMLPHGGQLMVADGNMRCNHCAADLSWMEKRLSMGLSGSSLRYLHEACRCLPEDWPTSEMAPENLREASRAIDALLQYHLGIEWDKGYFRRC